MTTQATLDEPLSDTLRVIRIARVAHEINRAYCAALGDFSQSEWRAAPDWQRDSAMNGVRLHLANPDAGPEASHESWMRQKLDEGWVYGPEKDPFKKTHHCLVPFAQLPKTQQAKDFLFRAVVHALKDDL
jgi:RyR domain.